MANTDVSTTNRKRPIPRKLNQGMIDALSLAISKGNYYVTACALCDITEQALWDWNQQAVIDYEEGLTSQESLYINLIEALKKAEAEAEARRVERVEAAGIGGAIAKRRITTFKDGTQTVEETFGLPQWLADMTHLERRHPDRWGRRERRDININETKTINITRVEVVMPLSEAGQIVQGEVKELKEGE